MNHVVTGGAGFIGSAVVSRLLAQGGRVLVIDDLSSGQVENIAEHLPNPNFSFLQKDILTADLRELLGGVHDVWHLAALPDVRQSADQPGDSLRENIMVTFRVLEASRYCRVDHVVFASSSTVYGEAEWLPTPENYGPLCPTSIYGATKLSGESLISAYVSSYGMRGTIARLANIIGPRSTHGVIPDFCEKLRANPAELEILGDGAQRKSYLYVEDCVEAMFSAAAAPGKLTIYNIGSTDAITVTRIAEIVCGEMALRPKFRFTGGTRGWVGDVPLMQLDVTRVLQTGWLPKLDSEAAVRLTVKGIIEKHGKAG